VCACAGVRLPPEQQQALQQPPQPSASSPSSSSGPSLSLSLTKTKLPTSADAHRSTIAARNCEDECGGGQQKEQQQQNTVVVNLGFLHLGFR